LFIRRARADVLLVAVLVQSNPIDDLGKVLTQQNAKIKQLEVRVQEEAFKASAVAKELAAATAQVSVTLAHHAYPLRSGQAAAQNEEASKTRAELQRLEVLLKAKDDDCQTLTAKVAAVDKLRANASMEVNRCALAYGCSSAFLLTRTFFVQHAQGAQERQARVRLPATKEHASHLRATRRCGTAAFAVAAARAS